jgi:hypothetical protein
MPLPQAAVAVAVVKDQMAGAIGNHRHVPQHPGGLEHLHAQQTLVHLRPQAFVAGHGCLAGEVIEGVVDGTGGQGGAQQTIEVAEHVRAFGAELEVELAATAQLQHVKKDAPAGEEAARVGNRFLVTTVGQLVQPGIPQGEEMAEGAYEQGADLTVGGQVLPWRRRR